MSARTADAKSAERKRLAEALRANLRLRKAAGAAKAGSMAKAAASEAEVATTKAADALADKD